MVKVYVTKGFVHPGGAAYPKGSRAAFDESIAATLFQRRLAVREQEWPVEKAQEEHGQRKTERSTSRRS